MSEQEKTVAASDRLYETLKSEIASGELSIGEKLTIDKMAKRNHVSHTPIREVLRRLSHDGLVDLRPNEGAYVRKLSIDEAIEIAEIRSVLEQLAARWLAEQGVAPDMLENMKQTCKEFSQAENFSEVGATDLKLHELFLACAGKGILNRILNGHAILLRAFMNQGFTTVRDYHKNLVRSAKEHFQIVEAIEDGDANKAARVMKQHLTAFVKKLRKTKPYVAERSKFATAVNSEHIFD